MRKMERKKLQLKPKFIVIVTLSLAVILVLSAVIELGQIKKEILHIMSEEATSLMESIAVSSDNATLAYTELEHQVAERLLNNARMIARLDSLGGLSKKALVTIAEENHLYRINLFDDEGDKVLASHDSVHGDLPDLHQPQQFIQPILDGKEKEIVIGFKESRHGLGQRYAVAVRRSKGGAVVVNIDSEEMLQLRKEIGVGRLINDIAEKEGIHYVVIQDTTGIIAASRNITSMSKISTDPFLIESQNRKTASTRLIYLDGTQVFEAAAPFLIDGVPKGLFRIGLKTDHIAEANSRTKRRLALISLILLAGGVLVFSFIIVNQNYAVLDEAYLKTKSYTGNILASMTDAVIAIDRNEKITLFNRTAEDIFGISEKEAVGKECTELVQADSVLEKTLRTGESIKDFETEYDLKKRKATLSFNTFTLRGKNGEVDSAVAVIKDLTERRAMEENLRRKEKLTAMGELASGVAHEVRNPLNAIGMIAQRLSKEFEPKTDAGEYKSLSKTVVDEVKRINDIIRRFLKFARPPELELRETNINDLLDEVVHLVNPVAEDKNAAIETEYENLLKVSIDQSQMKQFFLNLLQNSLQAHSSEVSIKAFSRESDVVVEIKDTGDGIPKENLPKIFDLYFTTKEDGTGMGLSIANQIVAAHGGRIEVESEIEVGTTFRIYLPGLEESQDA